MDERRAWSAGEPIQRMEQAKPRIDEINSSWAVLSSISSLPLSSFNQNKVTIFLASKKEKREFGLGPALSSFVDWRGAQLSRLFSLEWNGEEKKGARQAKGGATAPTTAPFKHSINSCFHFALRQLYQFIHSLLGLRAPASKEGELLSCWLAAGGWRPWCGVDWFHSIGVHWFVHFFSFHSQINSLHSISSLNSQTNAARSSSLLAGCRAAAAALNPPKEKTLGCWLSLAPFKN